MYPILFEGDKTTFTDYGLGVLSDCLTCKVVEERNGAYELEMTYPVDGIHFSDIHHSRILYAKPSEDKDNQAFRIYKISKPINGIVTVNAEHVSYQLSYIPTGGFTANSAANTLAGLKNNAYESCPFTFWTDNQTVGTYKQDAPRSIRASLGGVQGSFLDVFGGEYEWDNFTVKNHSARGTDNGVTLRYGKNITDIKQEENIENTYTGVCPYWIQEDTKVELPEHVLHAATASNFPYPRTIPLDLSSSFQEQPTVAQLRAAGNAYMVANNIGIPAVNITISFVALWQTEEYKDIAPLEKVGLCDYVHVYFEKLGISATAKVIKTEYDVLLERYEKIELGNAKSTLGDTIINAIQTSTEDKVSFTELETAVQRATSLITGNQGGHVRFIYDSDGLPQEILIMNTEDMETATKIWRWNLSGLGYSSDGGENYGLAMTQDGAIVADFITTGTLKSVNIEASNSQTGYYTKMNTNTGALTWSMANSSMDANGSLTAHSVTLDNGTAKLYNNTLEVAGQKMTGYGGIGVDCSDGNGGGGFVSPHVYSNSSLEDVSGYAGGHVIVTVHDGSQDVSTIWAGTTTAGLFAHVAGGNVVWGVGTTSDERLKENIQDTSENGLDVINRIRHIKFDWKDGEWNSFYKGHQKIGYLANQLQEIDEDFVTIMNQESWKMEDVLSINTQPMFYYVTKAIQELSAKVETLEKEVAELKGGNK